MLAVRAYKNKFRLATTFVEHVHLTPPLLPPWFIDAVLPAQQLQQLHGWDVWLLVSLGLLIGKGAALLGAKTYASLDLSNWAWVVKLSQLPEGLLGENRAKNSSDKAGLLHV